MFFDTHAHLTDSGLHAELEDVLHRAGEARVTCILAVASDLATSRESLAIVRNHSQVLASAGVHPELAGRVTPGWEAELEDLIVRERPVAVGECGLDAHHPDPPLAAQVPVLRAQVRLAKKHRLPLVLHSRKAAWEVLAVIEEEQALDVGGVFHCISDDEVFARAAMNAGFHLGLGGTCTYPRNDVLRTMIKRFPRDRLLLETDAPYLAPQVVRGKRNEPAFVTHTASVVAEAVGVSVEELATCTRENGLRLFRSRPTS